MRVIGVDIGGANLKASDGESRSVSRPFAIWKHPEQLSQTLRSVLNEFDFPQNAGSPRHLAVTMTAELADCFETKAEGVREILAGVTAAVECPVHVWQRGGEFMTPEEAREFPELVAAANWHALSTWAGRMSPRGAALLVDIGSTTTDIIPLSDGLPAATGGTDFERLRAGELVYTGVRRTPVCAVVSAVTVDQQPVPLAAEFFASMHDVGVILGETPEEIANTETADGRPATIDGACGRLARMLCCDRTDLPPATITAIAREIREVQVQQVGSALGRVVRAMPQPPGLILLAGEGEGLARRLVGMRPELAGAEVISLWHVLGLEHSMAACAFALARLGIERIEWRGRDEAVAG